MFVTLSTYRPAFVATTPRRAPLRRSALRVRADGDGAAKTVDKAALLSKMDASLAEYKSLPPSMKEDGSLEASATVLSVLNDLKAGGEYPRFGSLADVARRNVFPRELTQAGILNQESIGAPSIRNDAAFLISVVGVTSAVAVVSAAVLPGEAGFFVPYLSGGVSIAVLAIGSTAPGLLQVGIDFFSRVFPDYRERMLKHEAGHFLVAYLCGVPVTAYSLDLGKEHTDLLDAKLQRKMMTPGPAGKISASDVDLLAVIAMAGVAAEGMSYEQVTGQNADLFLLQKILNKSQDKLPAAQQQTITRWAVWEAANIIKANNAAYEALMERMKAKANVSECIAAIEGAK